MAHQLDHDFIANKNSIFALIVEDNLGDQELLHAMIEEDSVRHVNVEKVNSLATALDSMKKNRYDLVLLDLGLPDSLGVQTFVTIHDMYPKQTVIIMTGNDNLKIATQCLDLGAQDFLVKGHMQGFITHAMHNAIVRNATQEALNNSYDDLRNMLNDYHSPILIFDLNSCMVFKNIIANDMFEFEVFEGTVLEEILGTKPRFTCKDKYGDERIFEKHFSFINWYGKNAKMFTFDDISEKVLAEAELQLSYQRLHSSYAKALQGMSAAIELRDPYTSGHQRRVAELAVAISKELGLDKTRQEIVFLASIVHDLGKLSIPAEILMRPTKLTDLEYDMIKTHAEAGYQILKDIDFPWPIADIVRQHHERMNGSGYPIGLKGEEILYEARIIAVSDVIEAMASHRPYRAALGMEKAMDEIRKNTGLLYDSKVVEACLSVLSGSFVFT